MRHVFFGWGGLRLHWLCGFIGTELWPVSFIRGSLTEVTAPCAVGQTLPWCTSYIHMNVSMQQSSAQQQGDHYHSFTVVADLCIWALLHRLILNNETLLTSALRPPLSPRLEVLFIQTRILFDSPGLELNVHPQNERKLGDMWGRSGCEQKRKWSCPGCTKHFLSGFQKCVHNLLQTFILLFPGCRQSIIVTSIYIVFILGFWYDGSMFHLIKMTSLFSVWKYCMEVNRSSAFHWSSPPQRLFSHPVLVKGWIVMEKEQRGGKKTWSRHRNG